VKGWANVPKIWYIPQNCKYQKGDKFQALDPEIIEAT